MNLGTSLFIAVAQTDLNNWQNSIFTVLLETTLLKTEAWIFEMWLFHGPSFAPHVGWQHRHGLSPDLAWNDHRCLKNITFLDADALCLLWTLCSHIRVRFGVCLFVFKNLPSQTVLLLEMYLSCTWKKKERGGAGWHILNYYILQNRLPVVSVCTL